MSLPRPAEMNEKSSAPVPENRRISTSSSPSEHIAKEPHDVTLTGPPPNPPAEVEVLTGFKLYAVMFSITLVGYVMLLDTAIIATAVPYITNEFHSLTDVGWYGSAYQLASSALQPLTGKIYTKFNVKWSFLSFFALFELGSLICGVANSSKMLIVGRAVAGMGGSGLMNGALTIVTSSVPLARQPVLMGILFGCSQLGILSGPLIGGAFTEHVSWRWCFYINLPLGGVVAGYLVWVHIPEFTKKAPPLQVVKVLHRELDLVGFALLSPAAIQLLLALQWGGHEYAWDSATIIGLFVGSAATFAVWGVWNWHKGDDALIPLSIATKRVVWSSCVTGMTLYAPALLSAYFLPIYFQAIRGVSPTQSGLNMLPSVLGQLTASVVTGAMVTRTGYVIPYVVFAIVISGVTNGLISRFNLDTPTAEWAGLLFLTGFGRGSGMQMPMISSQTVLEADQVSLAMSLLMFVQFMSTAIALSIDNTIFNQSLRPELETYAPQTDIPRIIGSGATAFRGFISPEDLPGVLVAYNHSIRNAFYFITAIGVSALPLVWFMGWHDIRKKKKGDEVDPIPAAGDQQA